ncbi:ribonuclease P protein component [Saccharicrinis sp. FJH54]|uniref:ribonuclease P protein component n=1 Tax=Saccharicrinis sp. FJH54 TaxID=3344665 RepID=UPI0035D4D776
MSDKTFKKEERLSGKLAVSKLFTSGKSFFLHPFLVYYTSRESGADHSRLLISVSKKNYKRAVHRNLVKRRIREAYRQSKPEILPLPGNEHYDIALVYISKEIHPFQFIKSKMNRIFKKISEGNDKNS